MKKIFQYSICLMLLISCSTNIYKNQIPLNEQSSFRQPSSFKEPNFLSSQDKLEYGQAADKVAFFENFVSQNSFYFQKEEDLNKALIDADIKERKFLKNRNHLLKDIQYMFYSFNDFNSLDKNTILQGLINRNSDENSLLAISRFTHEGMQDQYCKDMPLKIGEIKTFGKDKPVGLLASNHTLKKISEKKYQVNLNLDFIEKGKPDSELANQIKLKSIECIKNVNQFLLGPDGQSLEIKLLSKEELDKTPKNQIPPKMTIEIVDSSSRGDMVHFSPTYDCPTITHEILHQTGLVDEYKEAWSYSSRLSCRINPKAVTLMGSRVYSPNVVGRTIKCECATSSCKDRWANLNSEIKKKLENSDSPCNSYYIQAWQISNEAGDSSEKSITALEGDVLTFYKKPMPGSSILTPNQFKKIISGYCNRGNETYDKCSTYAYINKESPLCQNIPKECSDDSEYLGIPK